MKTVREALHAQWGVEVGSEVTWADCISNYIQKPVFIVFDEIGKAFKSADPNKSRDEFISFVSSYCVSLSWAKGVHYLLCGRDAFLSNVGIRAENTSIALDSSPGSFARVNLNPIRKDYIAEIIEKTFLDEEKISDILLRKCPNMSIEEIINMLYMRTAGHPRSLLVSIRGTKPFDDGDYSATLLSEVGQAVRLYRTGIKQLFEHRNEPRDLNQLFQRHRGNEISFEHLATRIFAGYTHSLDSTQLFLPPAVESYLMRYFLPFSDFVLNQEKVIRDHYMDKSRIFEALLLKWFQSMGSSEKSIGNSWNGFCPRDSVLSNITLSLNPEKTVDGVLILAPGFASGIATLSVTDFSLKLRACLLDNSVNIYFPAPKSCSPDIILVQPQEGKVPDLLIGIQAKCYSSGSISARVCVEEGEKFYRILQTTRSVRQRKKLDGVLIMCATCGYTQSDFDKLTQTTRSMVWKGHPKEWTGFEILIINLSSPALRKEFFSLAQGVVGGGSGPSCPDGDRVNDIIEEIINYE